MGLFKYNYSKSQISHCINAKMITDKCYLLQEYWNEIHAVIFTLQESITLYRNIRDSLAISCWRESIRNFTLMAQQISKTLSSMESVNYHMTKKWENNLELLSRKL